MFILTGQLDLYQQIDFVAAMNRLIDLYPLSILIQRENPALPAKDECSDAQSEPRTEQGESESRKLW